MTPLNFVQMVKFVVLVIFFKLKEIKEIPYGKKRSFITRRIINQRSTNVFNYP